MRAMGSSSESSNVVVVCLEVVVGGGWGRKASASSEVTIRVLWWRGERTVTSAVEVMRCMVADLRKCGGFSSPSSSPSLSPSPSSSEGPPSRRGVGISTAKRAKLSPSSGWPGKLARWVCRVRVVL